MKININFHHVSLEDIKLLMEFLEEHKKKLQEKQDIDNIEALFEEK